MLVSIVVMREDDEDTPAFVFGPIVQGNEKKILNEADWIDKDRRIVIVQHHSTSLVK